MIKRTLFLLFALPAAAASQELSIKGVLIGAEKSEVLAAWGINEESHCNLTVGTHVSSECKASITFAGIPDLEARALFVDEKVCAIRVLFNEVHYRRIKAALIVKYGPPKSIRSDPATNAMNVEFDNEVATWVNGDQYLTGSRRETTLDEGNVMLYEATCIKPSDSEARKNAEDL